MNTTKKQPVNPFGWDKIFPASDKVECKKVTFKNRYGITLVGNLYTPKDREADKLPLWLFVVALAL
ncbi:Uncharacterized conserved protein [Porphyromonas cangingivalis]|uniref:Uncharacterized protein n=1 Tax=Porphyromonas cangingivalis TaxID=36874 RepID=A0A1T4P381_PORCN|nr:hypothetical protein SAMN02745205_02070 [Porphyromonas cangingivalis]VEJ03605.1 Uncharacterized conserved protein [Porphyromonas cangingivalis]